MCSLISLHQESLTESNFTLPIKLHGDTEQRNGKTIRTIRKSITFRGTLWIIHFPLPPLIATISRKASMWYFAFCVVRNNQINFINSLGLRSKVKWPFTTKERSLVYILFCKKGNPKKKILHHFQQGF